MKDRQAVLLLVHRLNRADRSNLSAAPLHPRIVLGGCENGLHLGFVLVHQLGQGRVGLHLACALLHAYRLDGLHLGGLVRIQFEGGPDLFIGHHAIVGRMRGHRGSALRARGNWLRRCGLRLGSEQAGAHGSGDQ